MATPILTDHAQVIDQLTNPVQSQPLPVQVYTPTPRPVGLMDFSNIDSAFKACDLISNSSFCPKSFQGKSGDVLCAIQYGLELGLSPMQALQTIAVINGKPSIYGDGLMALCQSFSECEDIQESFNEAIMAAARV